jgi:hypothetical protein
MFRQTNDARDQLTLFDATQDPADLENAIRGLESVSLANEQGGDRLDARREAMRLWLAVLAALDEAKDPAFDPNDMPMMRVAPPTGSGGRRYSFGTDPHTIPEPDVRARYQASIAKNRKKAEFYSVQSRLRLLEDRAQPGAEGFIRRYYSKADRDLRELKDLVEGTRIPAPQKQRLLAIRGVIGAF